MVELRRTQVSGGGKTTQIQRLVSTLVAHKGQGWRAEEEEEEQIKMILLFLTLVIGGGWAFGS